MVTGGAVIYSRAVTLFSDSRSGFEYRFCLNNQPGWLTNEYWGLWPLLEFVGALAAIFFMVMSPQQRVARTVGDVIVLFATRHSS